MNTFTPGPCDTDLLAALERLAPAERVAFVLHDLYDWHFEDVAGALHAQYFFLN